MTAEEVECDRYPTTVHPMEPISSRQNLPCNIERLAAQQRLYSCAKGLTTLQLVLAGLTSIIGAIALGLGEKGLPLVAFMGILVPFYKFRFVGEVAKSHKEDCRGHTGRLRLRRALPAAEMMSWYRVDQLWKMLRRKR